MTTRAVGIVTLPGDTNYGNKLQNYALQESIRSLGVDRVESIDGLPRSESKQLKTKRLAATAFGRRRELVARVLGREADARVKDQYICPPARRESIRQFSDQFIQPAPMRYSLGASNDELVNRYDHIVVGSDQVWNPAFTQCNSEWFLSFAHPVQRVAYAASIGIPDVPNYVRGRYRRGLNGIHSLSVREDQAARTVSTLTAKTPPVVLDPTMLLPAEHWDGLAKRPDQLKTDGYIATFMLASGDTISDGGANLAEVRDHAQSQGLSIADLHSPNDPELLAMGPQQFLGAIQSSSLLVTDSFHATVFAILFHRPFLLVPRGAMNARFTTLLRHAGLGNRLLSETKDIDQSLDIDWGPVDAQLEQSRTSSIEFLARSLDVIRD